MHGPAAVVLCDNMGTNVDTSIDDVGQDLTKVWLLVTALLTELLLSRDEKRFTISEMTADWHKLVISQFIVRLRSSIVNAS